MVNEGNELAFSRTLQLADILAAKTRMESTSMYLQCLLQQLQPPPEEPLGHLALLGHEEYSRYIGTIWSVSPSSAMGNRSCQNLSDDQLSTHTHTCVSHGLERTGTRVAKVPAITQ